jgi:regulator of sigma E protease
LTWLLVVAGFSLLIILHEAGHFAVAKAVGMRVERFSLFFVPVLRKKIGETEYCIGAIPAGGYVKISGMNPDEKLPDEVRTRAYYAQPVWKRIVVIAAGPAVNLVLAFLLLLVFFSAIGPERATREVDVISKGFPAAGVLQRGDRLVAVDGRGGSVEQLLRRVASHKCPERPPKAKCKAATPAKVTVVRDGRRRSFELTPVYDNRAKRTRLGFSYAVGPRKPYSLSEALDVSVDQFWFISKATLSLPARVFNPEQRKEITGVVGVSKVAHDTILSDVADAVALLALVSLSLAIVNLFPFLPLDGGHIFWAIVEKIRRKPVPFSVMERAGVVGFMLVLGLFLIGFTNDIGRLTGGGFDVR